MNRWQFSLLAAGTAVSGPLAVPARPAGTAPIRITKVKTAEVRGVVSGKGLVLPWDPKKIPHDTRDYVMAQFFTDSGLVGTTMDGDEELPAGIGEIVRQKAEYFIGKDPFELEVHNREFFQKEKTPVRLFFLEVGLWNIIALVVHQTHSAHHRQARFFGPQKSLRPYCPPARLRELDVNARYRIRPLHDIAA